MQLHSWLIYSLFAFLLFFLADSLFAQSLWEDHNPYAVGSNLQAGTILKIEIDEPISIVYDYDNLTEDSIDVKLVPDTNLTGFLPPASTSRNIVKKAENRLNSRSRLHLKMAVTITDKLRNGIVSFTGSKLISQEGNVSRQQIRISGRVHSKDISTERLIHSNHVADFQIVVVGAPVPRSRNLPLKREESDQENQTVPSAKLTDEEKQQLLLEYINRLLGESAAQ